MTKRTRIVDNSCLLRQYKWNTIKIRLPQLRSNAPYGVNFMSILTFSSVAKRESIIERLFWQLGTCFSGHCRYGEVAVVERFKQESMYGLSTITKKVALTKR